MIAKHDLPQKYVDWNDQWGAPYNNSSSKLLLKKFVPKILSLLDTNFKNNKSIFALRAKGLFSMQINNSTRTYEYPWAFEVGQPKRGQNVLDVGGGFGGFQFILSKIGLNVTTIDPGDNKHSWKYNKDIFIKLNKSFKTNVKLVQTTLDKANILSSSIDTVYCISVIEHLSENERNILLSNVKRVLKTNGLLILTVDLFLDLIPFTDMVSNKWGVNVPISAILKESKLKLISGNKNELYGFPEFDQKKILESLPIYLIGTGYPVLSQLIVLQK